MKCILIDDEATARALLRKSCAKVAGLEVVKEFDNAFSAIEFLSNNSIDLVFLDIHMPDFSGFNFLDSVKKPPLVIITTSDRDCAIDAFDYENIVDYLIKPIAFPRFVKAVVKAESKVSEKETQKELYVNIDRRLVKINLEDIYIVEARGDYIRIKAEDKNHLVHSTMKKIEERLPKELFLKVHRSYIVNTKKIIDIEDNSILIKKDVVPVSRAHRSALMEKLNLL